MRTGTRTTLFRTCTLSIILSSIMLGAGLLLPFTMSAAWGDSSGMMPAGTAEPGPIANENEAVKRGRALPFVPTDAVLDHVSTWESPSGPVWRLTFVKLDPNGVNHMVRISPGFAADTGALVELSVHEEFPMTNHSQQAITAALDEEEAAKIARSFIDGLNLGLDAVWVRDPYPESASSRRNTDLTMHHMKFARAVNGIPAAEGGMFVTIRPSGEVGAYSLNWTGRQYVKPGNLISLDKARTIMYEKAVAVLRQTVISTNPSRTAYDLFIGGKVDALTGSYIETSSHNPENLNATTAISPDEAKRALLPLYDVELQYQWNYQTDQSELFYVLRLKPSVVRFYTGAAPLVDANTGEWIDLIGNPIADPNPTPDQPTWGYDLTSLPENIDYTAGLVLNGQPLLLEHEPIIHEGVTLVPLRGLLEKMNAGVQWNEGTRRITITRGDVQVELALDDQHAQINGKAFDLEVPAKLVDSVTYIPARFVSEAFGAEVQWVPDSRLVLIHSDGQQAVPAPSEIELRQWRADIQRDWDLFHNKQDPHK